MSNKAVNEDIFPDEQKKVLGPGRLLQIAREEKNLRPEDIAYEIRLTPSQVVALDEDDYSRMPEETYVRGYLRNYARLVGVPENEILMAFARFTRSEEVTPAPTSLPVESEPGKNSRVAWIVAVSSIVAVIVLSAIWVIEPSDEPVHTDSKSATLAIDEKPDIEEVPVGTSTLKLEKAADETGLDTSPITPEKRSEVDSEKEMLTKAETSAPLERNNIAQTVEKSNASGGQVTSEGGVLIISYKKDSWTDVRDANGVKLLYRTVKAGEKVALAGALPISLFFGFAQGVEVKFNGKAIDVVAHTRGVFARFTVGEAVNQ